MYVLTVKDMFSAAHRLSGAGGKCEELHGHNYVVEVSVQGEKLGDEGVLIDFRQLKEAVKQVLLLLDHKYLNDIDFFQKHSSSSEYIAHFIYMNLKEVLREKSVKLSEVRVWESENSCASFREEK
ncbi:MAG: 6-carboxytetrahydropterin synthase QueD [Deltaproteobacteria bacterium]|nr:6-carboxytetrahydropterin synthase QueD [Deltaproteobacteria bacterium]